MSYLSLLLEHICESVLVDGKVIHCDASEQYLPDDSADLLVTDPPYYDAVSYADLSHYFYVWLKRLLFDVEPELFRAKLSPKKQEIIVELTPADGSPKDRSYYEHRMAHALSRGRTVCKPSGTAVVVFAHKTTSGWESLLHSLIESGWTVSASWPIDTERPGKISGIGQARLMSSVHIVCRPRENAHGSLQSDVVGEWREVLHELPRRIHEWLPRLAHEGIVGADAIFACIGPALEIFSRFSRVERADGARVGL